MSAYLKEDGMNWARLVVIVVGAGVVSSLTDWFFADDWIHDATLTLKSGVKVPKVERSRPRRISALSSASKILVTTLPPGENPV
jgi:uncharacterized membrane protein YdbT with pleckstrin-like domain